MVINVYGIIEQTDLVEIQQRSYSQCIVLHVLQQALQVAGNIQHTN